MLQRLPDLLLVCPLFLMQSNQKPVDNLTVLNRLAATVVDSIIVHLSPDSATSVTIQSQSQQHAGNWWIENWLLRKLKERGVSQIYINQPQSPGDGLNIEFQIRSLGVQYNPIAKKGLVERQVQVSLDVRVVEKPTGLVRVFDKISELSSDTVAVSIVQALEQKDFSFTMAVMPEQRGIRKYLEPFIAITTTTGIVFLFFHMRSK